MNKILSLFFIFSFALSSQAVEMGVPVQLKFKNPAGEYPDASGVLFSVQILSPLGGCVIYEEDFANQTIVSGTISLALGSGTPAGFNPTPALTVTQAYENLTAKLNLKCVDANNIELSAGQTYNPAATDTRVLRVRATINGTPLVADFIQRAAPYALHAQTVGGKVAADILVQNGSTSLNQANLESIFANNTKFTKLSNLATNGVVDNAMTATTAGSASYFTANLLGDVTGTQSATVVAAIRGVGVGAIAPVSGQVLAYNGSQYIPMTITASAPVSSVNGQTGAVVLNSSNIAGVVTSATSLLGDVTGNVSATVVSTVGGKNAASVTATVNDVYAATSLPTPSTIAKRDGSGNLTASTFYAADVRVNAGVRFYEVTNTNYVTITAPAAFANYNLTLPTTDGNNGEVLQTDGSGALSWVPSGNVTSASIATALGFTPADNTLVVIKSNNLSDLTSSTVARVNLGLGAAATLNVGTIAGTVAAGDDARITGALAQTSFDAYVAGATCSAGQSMYWNSVSSLFACQNIIISGDVTGNASTTTVTKVQGVGVSFAALANNNIMQYNGSNFVNRAIPTCAGGEYLTFNGAAWSCAVDAGGGGAVTSINVVAPISSTGGSTPTLSIVQANASTNGYLASADWTTFNNKVSATSAAVIAALGYTPANNAASGTYATKANNLSDLTSATVARTNLGLGAAAVLSVGTTAGTVAAGDDSRIANALQTSSSFSGDVTGMYNSIALVNSGVTSGTYTKFQVNAKGLITSGSTITFADVVAGLGYTPANNSASGTYLVKASNLSDVASATVARTNLGLGAAATLNVGTIAGTVAAGNDARITGSLSQTSFNTYVAGATCTTGQSMYWNSVSSLFACQNIILSGDVTGNASTTTVTKIQGVGASFTAIANNNILQYNGTNIVNRAVPTCVGNQYLTFNGTNWTCATDIGSGGIVSSVIVAAPLQSTGGSAPTLSMTQATGSVSGYLTGVDWTTFNNKITSSTASIAQVLGFSPANSATILVKSNNLSDLVNVVLARANLGLGGFATVSSLDLGSASATGTLAAARMPALTGDVTSTVGTVGTTVEKIQGVNVSANAPTTGQLLVYNGASWIPTTDPVSTTRKTADQAFSSTNPAAATQLSFSVVNGVTYRFAFSIIFRSASTLAGAEFGLTAPAGTLSAIAIIPIAGDGTGAAFHGSITASNDTVTATGVQATNTDYFARVEGIYVATATGTLQLIVGSETNGQAITVRTGSMGEIRVVP